MTRKPRQVGQHDSPSLSNKGLSSFYAEEHGSRVISLNLEKHILEGLPLQVDILDMLLLQPEPDPRVTFKKAVGGISAQ
jgi:hypothetical protein